MSTVVDTVLSGRSQEFLNKFAEDTPRLTEKVLHDLQIQHHKATKRLREEEEEEDTTKKQKLCTDCSTVIPEEYKEPRCDKCYCQLHQIENPNEGEDDGEDECEDESEDESEDDPKEITAPVKPEDYSARSDDDKHREEFDGMLKYTVSGQMDIKDFNIYLRSVNKKYTLN